MKTFFGITSFNSFVTGVEFGPGLFEQNDPKLVLLRLRECWLVVQEGYVFVHIDGHPFSLVKHLH